MLYNSNISELLLTPTHSILVYGECLAPVSKPPGKILAAVAYHQTYALLSTPSLVFFCRNLSKHGRKRIRLGSDDDCSILGRKFGIRNHCAYLCTLIEDCFHLLFGLLPIITRVAIFGFHTSPILPTSGGKRPAHRAKF